MTSSLPDLVNTQVTIWAAFISATQIWKPKDDEPAHVYRGIAAVDEQPQMLNCPFNRGCAKLSSHLRVFGRHGDMLFLFPSGSPSSSGDVMDTTGPHSSSSLSSPSASASTSSSSSIPRSLSAPQVQEDEIDQYLAKQDGKIYRNKDPQLWETDLPQSAALKTLL